MYMREVDVTGIDNHELNALKLVDAASRLSRGTRDWYLPTVCLPWTQLALFIPPDNSGLQEQG
jgi:hypothetical protein